jgi:serine/threonine-protein kinase
MVAAAGGEGALPLRTAWLLFGTVIILIGAVLLLVPYSTDFGLAPMEKSPAVLRERAKEIVVKIGYEKNPTDSTIWFSRDYGLLSYLAKNKPAPDWRKIYRDLGAPILFGYRQSPRPLVALEFGEVTEANPPLEVSGMVNVVTDGLGRLRGFRAVPPQLEPKKPAPAEFDWAPVFAEARLEPARFQRMESKWIPPMPFDERAEWTGSLPELPDVSLTVIGAAFRGSLVHFEVRGAWMPIERMEQPASGIRQRIGQVTLALIIVGVSLAALYFVRRNLRQGRGDRKGAFRISLFVLLVSGLHWDVTAHHAGDLVTWVLESATRSTALALFIAAFLWFLYMTIEPYLRRRIPELLIGWARLLEGRFRDPRVGRDILIGAAAGASLALITHIVNSLPAWFPFQGQTTVPMHYLFSNGTNPLSYLLLVNVTAVVRSFLYLTLYFIFRMVLRKPPLAVAALGVVVLLVRLGGENAFLEIPQAVVSAVLITWVMSRVGLLATAAMAYFVSLLSYVAPSLDFSSWYATYSLPGLIFLVALTLYAFHTSLGGQPVFGAASIED